MGVRFAVVAGEASGDVLGASLIRALKGRFPGADFYGVAGPRMEAEGCRALESVEALSVMGLAEVVRHLPRLLRLRGSLVRRFAADRPDVFIGIDAPDFNLRLERPLRELGIRTAHLVSPSVWAWRPGRVKAIARAVDLMLCLLPFEERFYRGHSVRAAYVGHPLADELDPARTPGAARRALGLPEQGPLVAVLPGSRQSELRYLAGPMAGAVAWLAARVPGARFVTPLARPHLGSALRAAVGAHAAGADWRILDGQSREAMQAADVVLLASGTAALECMLLDRPMVVCYRGSALSAFLLRRLGLLKVRHVSLPNLLTPEPRVPELLQEDATAERLGAEVLRLLQDEAARRRQLQPFAAVRAELKRGAAQRAADEIAKLVAA